MVEAKRRKQTLLASVYKTEISTLKTFLKIIMPKNLKLKENILIYIFKYFILLLLEREEGRVIDKQR